MFAVQLESTETKLENPLGFLFLLTVLFQNCQSAVPVHVVSRNVTAPEPADDKNHWPKIHDLEPLLKPIQRRSYTVQPTGSNEENNRRELIYLILSTDSSEADNHREDLNSTVKSHSTKAHNLDELSVETSDSNESHNFQEDLKYAIRTQNLSDFIQTATAYVTDNLTELMPKNKTFDLFNIYRNLQEALPSDSNEAQNLQEDLKYFIRTQNISDFIQTATAYVTDNLTELIPKNKTFDLYNGFRNLQEVLPSVESSDSNEAQNFQEDSQSAIRTQNLSDFIQTATAYVKDNLTELIPKNKTFDLFNIYRNLPEVLQSVKKSGSNKAQILRDVDESPLKSFPAKDFGEVFHFIQQTANTYENDRSLETFSDLNEEKNLSELFESTQTLDEIQNFEDTLQSIRKPDSPKKLSLREVLQYLLKLHYHRPRKLEKIVRSDKSSDSYEI